MKPLILYGSIFFLEEGISFSFGSPFQRFHLCSLDPVALACDSTVYHDRGNLFMTWQLGNKGQKRRGWDASIPFNGTPPMT
jgi:hypothetical protein